MLTKAGCKKPSWVLTAARPSQPMSQTMPSTCTSPTCSGAWLLTEGKGHSRWWESIALRRKGSWSGIRAGGTSHHYHLQRQCIRCGLGPWLYQGNWSAQQPLLFHHCSPLEWRCLCWERRKHKLKRSGPSSCVNLRASAPETGHLPLSPLGCDGPWAVKPQMTSSSGFRPWISTPPPTNMIGVSNPGDSWWWTGKPGVLPSMGSQRVGHDWVTGLNWTELNPSDRYDLCSCKMQFSHQSYRVHAAWIEMLQHKDTLSSPQ